MLPPPPDPLQLGTPVDLNLSGFLLPYPSPILILALRWGTMGSFLLALVLIAE